MLMIRYQLLFAGSYMVYATMLDTGLPLNVHVSTSHELSKSSLIVAVAVICDFALEQFHVPTRDAISWRFFGLGVRRGFGLEAGLGCGLGAEAELLQVSS